MRRIPSILGGSETTGKGAACVSDYGPADRYDTSGAAGRNGDRGKRDDRDDHHRDSKSTDRGARPDREDRTDHRDDHARHDDRDGEHARSRRHDDDRDRDGHERDGKHGGEERNDNRHDRDLRDSCRDDRPDHRHQDDRHDRNERHDHQHACRDDDRHDHDGGGRPKGDDCGCDGSTSHKLPAVLDGFGGVLKMFAREADRGTVEVSFDKVLDKLDKAAQKLNDKAERMGLEDVDDTPLEATFGGDASAYGEDTFTSASMLGQAVDLGLVSYALGTATFTAAAEAAEGDTAVAIAATFADIAGADLVIAFTDYGETELAPGVTESFATATVSFIAIDLEFWDSCDGPIVIDGYAEDFDLDVLLDLDGNTADLLTTLDAFGEGTFAGVESDVLTIEDQLSGSTVIGTLAVG